MVTCEVVKKPSGIDKVYLEQERGGYGLVIGAKSPTVFLHLTDLRARRGTGAWDRLDQYSVI